MVVEWTLIVPLLMELGWNCLWLLNGIVFVDVFHGIVDERWRCLNGLLIDCWMDGWTD